MEVIFQDLLSSAIILRQGESQTSGDGDQTGRSGILLYPPGSVKTSTGNRAVNDAVARQPKRGPASGLGTFELGSASDRGKSPLGLFSFNDRPRITSWVGQLTRPTGPMS